ncbi:MAG: HEPN domain-containing protein [Candidatus Freyarchaeota archaeon]
MKNIGIANRGISRAARWLQGAERAMEDERWDDVVYSSQMAVEHSAKAVLISLGIDFPKEHDVSDALLQIQEIPNLPQWFREEIGSIADIVAELAEQRGLAGYGFEEGIDETYFKDYAPEALEKAKRVHTLCKKFIEETFQM